MKSLICLVSKGFNARLHSAAAFWLEINYCTDTSNFVNAVNGQWVKSSSSKTFKTLNPATGKVVSEIQDGNETDADKAVVATKKAFKLDSPWRSINPSKPRVLLNKLADFMKRDTVYLTSLETSDYSKRYTASYSVDVASSVQKGNLIAFNRTHQIPHGLISKIQTRTHRNYSTDSGNSSSSNMGKSTTRNDPEESSLNDIIESSKIDDPQNNFIFTASFKDHESVEYAEGRKFPGYGEYEENLFCFVKCRSAMEIFELDFGDLADIDFESVPEDLSWTEKDVIFRALQYKWIFANQSGESRVKMLMELVNDSKDFDSIAEFCECIAVAYEDLSRTVQELTLTPGLENPNYKCVASVPKVSKAVCLFMSTFDNDDYSQKFIFL